MRLLLILAVVLQVIAAKGQAYSLPASQWRKNLLENGDAEAAIAQGEIAGWKADTAVVSLFKYGEVANALPVDTNKFVPKGEYYFRFAGKNDSVERILRQEVDLRSMSDSIIKGKVTFYLAAELGGKDTTAGHAELSVTFYDTRGLTLESFSAKPITTAQRQKKTRFLHSQLRDTVPAQAVKAVIQLKAYRGATCAATPKIPCPWEVYADNISFFLIQPLLPGGKVIISKGTPPAPKLQGKP